jgi:hypothetical protein
MRNSAGATQAGGPQMHESFSYFGKRPTTPQEVIERVEDFVRKDLEGRFKDEFVFDQVIANPELDHYGDEFLHIYIIFDGNQKNLDPRWTNGIEGRLLDQLPDGELPHTPGHSFISKSEWKRIYKERIQ